MKSRFNFSSKCTVVLILALSAACSPELVSRKFTEAKQDFGPTRTDGDLSISEIKSNAIPSKASIRWKGEIETAAWYRTSDDLGWLSRTLANPGLGKFAYRMHRAVGRGVSWEHTFQNSAYASAAIGETRDDTKKAVNSGIAMLKAQEPIIEKLLTDRSQKFEWPTERKSLVAVVDSVEAFLKAFVRDVERSSVDKAVKKELVEELRINFGPRIQRIRAQIAVAYNATKTFDFVIQVRGVLKEEGVDLGSDIESKLDVAERLPREVEKIVDSRTALSVLIDFWRAASPQTREDKFKKVAPELYDFLHGKNDEDLTCIQTGCGPITSLKRVLFILPAIEEFGVEKIRKTLADAAEESIKSELETEAVKALPKIYQEVFSKIAGELARQRTNIAKISTDYGPYLRLVLNRVAVAKLGLKEKDPVLGAEPTRIRVDLGFSNAAVMTAVRAEYRGSAFTTGAAAIGAGMAAAIELHDHHIENVLIPTGLGPYRIKQALGRVFFEQINKVLIVGGFTTEHAKDFDALSVADDADTGNGPARFNLRKSLSSEYTFAVPDQIRLTLPGKPELVLGSVPPKQITNSVAGQAEMLKGLSRIALSLRDWEQTPFDEVLGAVNLADFVPDLPKAAVDRKLFPKELFYAAAIGNAGAILQNITKEFSTVGLIGPGGEMHWGNESDPSKDPTKQAIAATVFDLIDGERATTTKSVDVARFLSAIADFLRASDGIEKATAGVLIDAGPDGRRAVDQVLAARKDLKLLVMALANFLSSHAIGETGLVLPLFSRSADNRSLGMSGQPQLLDQAVVIRALLDASDVISAGIYRTAAVDLMSAMNFTFFRPNLGFYSESASDEGALGLEVLVSILVAGERVSPYMTRERLGQWVRVSRPWINALHDAAETLP